MSNQNNPKVFFCYASENQDLIDDFVLRFERENSIIKLYDKNASAGIPAEEFKSFANTCDIAVILVSPKLTKEDSYANRYEIPILLDRRKHKEVIIIPVLFSDTNFELWNREKELYFFQCKNNDLSLTRRSDSFGSEHNKKFAIYEKIDSRDRNSYHTILNNWVQELISKHPLVLERMQKSGDSLPNQTLSVSVDPQELNFLENIKEPCFQLLETKLRDMPDNYFDKNGFDRPAKTSKYYMNYFLLQSIKLTKLEKELNDIDVDNYSFFDPVKKSSSDVLHMCKEVQKLLGHPQCERIGLRDKIEFILMRLETLNDDLPNLIIDSSQRAKKTFIREHINPLIRDISLLRRKMSEISGKDVSDPRLN